MIAWIVLIVLFIIILVSLFFLFYDKIQYLYEKKKHRKRIYKILHYFAEEEDCYLLNDVKVFLAKDDPEPTCFDHLLFAEKYIYIITDFIAFGGVYGNVKDASLFLKKPSGKTVPIPNPIISGKERVRRIEEFINSAHEHKLFMSMTVYNPSLIVPKGIHIKDNTFVDTVFGHTGVKDAAVDKNYIPLSGGKFFLIQCGKKLSLQNSNDFIFHMPVI